MGFLEYVGTILNCTDLSCLTKSGHAVCLVHRLMHACMFQSGGRAEGTVPALCSSRHQARCSVAGFAQHQQDRSVGLWSKEENLLSGICVCMFIAGGSAHTAETAGIDVQSPYSVFSGK